MPQYLFDIHDQKSPSVLLDHTTHFEEQQIVLFFLVNDLDPQADFAVEIHPKSIVGSLVDALGSIDLASGTAGTFATHFRIFAANV